MARGALWLRSAVYVALVVALSNLLLLDVVDRALLEPVRLGIASAAGRVLALVHENVRVVGQRVFLGGSAVEIVNSCTGIDVGVFLASAMLVFPAPWRARVQGVARRVRDRLRRELPARAHAVLAERRLAARVRARPRLRLAGLHLRRVSRDAAGLDPARSGARCLGCALVLRRALRAGVRAARLAVRERCRCTSGSSRRATRVAAAGLRERAMESRALAIERRDDAFVYKYDLRVGAIAKADRAPVPQARVRAGAVSSRSCSRRPGSTRATSRSRSLGGGAIVFLLCVAMLMSDVELWEREALAAAGYPGPPGPFPIPLGFIEGLHRTAAAGLLPLILWAFFAASRARTARANTARHIARVSTPVFVFCRDGW